MLIKEYRIPLPMSVEEYRIAQLYMIQKKSRDETCGEGSGVEILENRPYTDGPGGSGQYTHKVYHIGMHIPSWFRSILPKAALRVEEESWNAYPYTRTRYTCPFVEKFSIDIETYYKPDTGDEIDVFNMSLSDRRQRTLDPIDIVKDLIPPHEYLAEEDPKLYKSVKTKRGPLTEDWIEEIKNNPGKMPIMCAYKLCKVEFRYWGMQSKIERFIHDVALRKVMVRAHRQAWCWQDEWYGLSIADIRQLEHETQLMLAQKMAEFSCNDEAEQNGASTSPADKGQEAKAISSSSEAEDVSGSIGDTLQGRGELTKQWSTSSKSSRSSKRGGSPSRHSISEWRMQSIARDSEDSSDDEFFDAIEDLSDSEEIFSEKITKWNSNDLIDKIESTEADEEPGNLFQDSAASSVERLSVTEDGSSQQSSQPCKIHVLVLVLHGGNILDTGGGDQSSKQGDVNTIASAFDTVMRVHYPAALGRLAIRLVPCPAICAEAFSLMSNLSPYSYDEGCLSNSQDHIPLAALPLLATSSPQYQEAVATVILRANQVYSDFLKSPEGACFTGQVCLIGDCVGGVLGFDALCYSNQTASESQNSSRRGSVVSVQDNDLLSPGIIVNNSYCSGNSNLEGSRHLSRSNVDITRSSADDPKKQLPRKRSDSSTYELDTIRQHQAFLSSLHSSVLRHDPGSRRSSSSTMLDGGTLAKFEFEVCEFFLFGSPLGLVLALRKTVIPSMDVSQLRPACQQVYNLFHPADPSASRLEPLLEKKFHLLPPFNVPRYQRFPLGDGNSALLVETVQSNPILILESSIQLVALRSQENVTETSIPVPVLNWQDGSCKSPATVESDVVQSHGGVFMDNSSPSSPNTAPHFRGFRRASEVSIASQVSGMADTYTASNIANKQACQLNHSKKLSLLSQLALPYNKSFLKSVSPKFIRKSKAQSSPLNRIEKSPETAPSRKASSVPQIPDLDIEQVAARWWGTKRIDFALYCPDALTAFPTVALPHLFHASYWESTDVVSFLLRQVMRHENSSILELDGKEVSEFSPSKPREKWLRKRTHVKIRNVTANHRVNDAVFTEDGQQVVNGRFMYGPLDMVTLTGEKVDIHIMMQPPTGEWVYFDTELTNSSGRISYVIPESKRLGIGVYPVKLVVRGDHTNADSYLTVLPKTTEFVVFSIDGSFAASVSIMGSDPKVRAGAVDVVRHWQDLGYLIIYVTGRPDMQKQRVVAWLSQHNFPHGIVSFCDGLVHDPLRHKANFLKSLITEAQMKVYAAYGSTKDISVYSSIGLSPSQIYIVGRPTKKMQHQCQFISDGYAAHLSQLEYSLRSRPAKSTARMVLRKGSFGLGGNPDFLRKRKHLLRTISSQPSTGTSSSQSNHNKPERTQSQSESERERIERGQRSMSLAAGCWGRSSSTKMESAVLNQK
ncbi:membrane-associated phosphatidylinositol transfer protein 2-like isoform X3 [Acipenser oxyrinchus oxyrinchus]|uniref:Membrane-associated phosphatidylinositol transfer protein 2-like isoform X3 n=1 Tax=Acipenser oxyrinchus oxyrinchus TaxID=40147 RepID=A0AAD8CY46_ACIOX|nr:membrane-associated phosphatidylinositol transfer protein 2-like isoform X3 [Acipenser oxyrinchus oxyrinchus]